MIEILVTLLVVAVVVYVLYLILGMLKLPEPIGSIIYIIMALVVLLWLLNRFLGFSL